MFINLYAMDSIMVGECVTNTPIGNPIKKRKIINVTKVCSKMDINAIIPQNTSAIMKVIHFIFGLYTNIVEKAPNINPILSMILMMVKDMYSLSSELSYSCIIFTELLSKILESKL